MSHISSDLLLIASCSGTDSKVSLGKHILKGSDLLRDVMAALKCLPDDLSKSLLGQCSEKMCELMKLYLNAINEEFTGIKTYAEKNLKMLLQEFGIVESLKSLSFDAKTVSAACSDIRVQLLYILCIHGKSSLLAARESMDSMLAFCNSHGSECPALVKVAKLIEAIVKDIQVFTVGSVENISSLTYVGHIIGTLTLVQSMLRDLQTGETRQTLCHRALQGVQKRGFLCADGIIKKVETIISGKPAAK